MVPTRTTSGVVCGPVSRAVGGGENDRVNGEMLKTVPDSVGQRDGYWMTSPKSLVGTSGWPETTEHPDDGKYRDGVLLFCVRDPDTTDARGLPGNPNPSWLVHRRLRRSTAGEGLQDLEACGQSNGAEGD